MTQYQLPFSNPDLVDGFGSTMYPRTRPHRGLDFAQSVGTPYGSVADGVVAYKGYSGELGYYMVIGHPDGMYTGYCHSNQSSGLAVGSTVTRGTILNLIGNTGFITGPHLHLTMSTEIGGVSYGAVQDPYAYIQGHLTADPTPDPAAPPVATGVWTTNQALRPTVAVRAASGKIRVTISAYGAGALVTYSISGTRTREEGLAAPTAQILLTNDPYGENTTARTWIQAVPKNADVVVQVECYGFRGGAFVASPSIVAEVVY